MQRVWDHAVVLSSHANVVTSVLDLTRATQAALPLHFLLVNAAAIATVVALHDTDADIVRAGLTVLTAAVARCSPRGRLPRTLAAACFDVSLSALTLHSDDVPCVTLALAGVTSVVVPRGAARQSCVGGMPTSPTPLLASPRSQRHRDSAGGGATVLTPQVTRDSGTTVGTPARVQGSSPTTVAVPSSGGVASSHTTTDDDDSGDDDSGNDDHNDGASASSHRPLDVSLPRVLDPVLAVTSRHVANASLTCSALTLLSALSRSTSQRRPLLRAVDVCADALAAHVDDAAVAAAAFAFLATLCDDAGNRVPLMRCLHVTVSVVVTQLWAVEVVAGAVRVLLPLSCCAANHAAMVRVVDTVALAVATHASCAAVVAPGLACLAQLCSDGDGQERVLSSVDAVVAAVVANAGDVDIVKAGLQVLYAVSRLAGEMAVRNGVGGQW